MSMFTTVPAKQLVGETITVLSGRLGSATLLEDRRAAILGLRSFAKDYPASVASGALRSLIGSLGRDADDVDTVRIVLETLLMLFSPNASSPEASDEIALWLADEFTQRQENIGLLLDLLEAADVHARLYALQLLSAIHSARPDRAEECVFRARLGISRLVAVLDDGRDAIRNEAVLLLTSLTPTSPDIQQLVAFESTFDKIFAIIGAEGSLSEGGRPVEDCLILLANLVRLNGSNQTLFRESGFVARLAGLLDGACGPDAAQAAELAPWAQSQRARNVYALLAVIRLFLVPGSSGLAQNQAAFFKHGVLSAALQLGFSRDNQAQIRVEALLTCADVIRANSALQEKFAELVVPEPVPSEPDSESHHRQTPPHHDHRRAPPPPPRHANGVEKVFVIDGLLDLTLVPAAAAHPFDLRYAACESLKAYFCRHDAVRLHFLSRAVEGHRSGQDESSNVLSILLRPPLESPPVGGDMYRSWFAAVIMFHLLADNPPAKAMAMAVTEGDASSGEEVVTSIQTLSAHLLGALSRAEEDGPVLVGYLMLLLGWLYEDMDAVDDFLTEGGNVQSLVRAVVGQARSLRSTISRGLCAMLLGFVYEFSTKDSPVPRATIHSIINSGMGKDVYVDRLSMIRSDPLMRDFEVTAQRLPDVYFDSQFVEFFKDSYSRAVRAIEREPGLEISVSRNGVQKGISRELVDSLKLELEAKEQQLQAKDRDILEVKAAADAAGVQLDQEARARQRIEAEAAQLQQSLKSLELKAAADLEQARRQADADADQARRRAEGDVEQIRRRAEADVEQARRKAEDDMARARQQAESGLEQARKQAETELERVSRRTDAEKADLRATISRLEVDLMKANKARTQELQAQKDGYEAKLAEQVAKTERAVEEERVAGRKLVAEREAASEAAAEQRFAAERSLAEKQASAGEEAASRTRELEAKLAEAVANREATQSELDDMLMVFGDLEEKVATYRARLVEAGQQVSDGEEDEEDEDDDEDDEDEEKADSGVD